MNTYITNNHLKTFIRLDKIIAVTKWYDDGSCGLHFYTDNNGIDLSYGDDEDTLDKDFKAIYRQIKCEKK